MWNFILLFVCAISGTCATPNDIFAQAETINGQQQSAYLVATKDDDNTTLHITPKTLTHSQGLDGSLTISMGEINNLRAKVEIRRAKVPLTTIIISHFPRNDGNENILLQVYSNGARLVSANYCTNQKNAQNIKDPQLSVPPASAQHDMLRAEISWDLPTSIDSHAYTLVISTILEQLPRFKVTCKTTAKERTVFDLVYPKDAMEPTILVDRKPSIVT